MNVAIRLESTKGARIDPRVVMPLAWALLSVLAELLKLTKFLNSHQLLPNITSTSVTLAGGLENSADLFDSMTILMARLGLSAALLNASENLLKTNLCDRMTLPDVRLPIAITHEPKLKELLAYDKKKDLILCQAQDWSELVTEYLKLLKALANISAAGFIPMLEVDGTPVTFPKVSATLFDHGYGAGRSIVSTCRVSGWYLVAGEVEVRIEGFRDDRVIRAHLSDAARLAAIAYRPPFTAAVQYSEAVSLLPLLLNGNGKVVIERLWDFEEQTEFAYS